MLEVAVPNVFCAGQQVESVRVGKRVKVRAPNMLGFEHERAYLFELHAPLLRRTAVSRSGFNRCASMPGALPEQLTACRHTRDACRLASDDLS